MQFRIQVGLASFEFMVNARRAIFYTFLTLFMAEALGANFIELGLVITLPMLANSTMQAFVWGRISDRIKRRRLLIVVGEICAGIGYLLIWTNITIFSIIIGLTLIEAIWSMSNTGWSALFADLTTQNERSTIMGRINSLAIVGQILGATIIGFIYDFPLPGAGFHWSFPLAAGIMFGSVITLVALVPEIEHATRIGKSNQSIQVSVDKFNKQSKYPRNYLIFLGIWGFLTLSWAAYLSLFTFYLRLSLNLNSIEIGLVRNINSGVGLVAAPIAGVLGDRVGRKPILIGAMMIQAVTTLLYGVANSLFAMLAVNAINGIVRPTSSTMAYALAADMIPEVQRGELFGVYNAVWTIAFGSSPTVVGGAFATWRQAQYLTFSFPLGASQQLAIVDTFYLSTGLILIGTLLFGIAVKEPTQKHKEQLTQHRDEPSALMDTLD